MFGFYYIYGFVNSIVSNVSLNYYNKRLNECGNKLREHKCVAYLSFFYHVLWNIRFYVFLTEQNKFELNFGPKFNKNFSFLFDYFLSSFSSSSSSLSSPSKKSCTSSIVSLILDFMVSNIDLDALLDVSVMLIWF